MSRTFTVVACGLVILTSILLLALWLSPPQEEPLAWRESVDVDYV